MRSRHIRWACPFLLGGAVLLPAGCQLGRAELNRTLLADRTPAAHTHNHEAGYQVRCPDVIEFTIPGKSAWSGPRPVHADGRVVFAEGIAFPVDGQTPPEIAGRLGGWLHVPARQIQVKVVEYRSQELFLLSPGSEVQQAIPYHGPETVIDLLQRVGGLPANAEADEIRIVRPHVADGKPPEVFTVNLRAILVDHDQQTNIRLEPSDQIHIGVSSGFPFQVPFHPPTQAAPTPSGKPATQTRPS
jgi:protein involved in polysaccharide export with SLBB domain